jgi:hypothetical protein
MLQEPWKDGLEVVSELVLVDADNKSGDDDSETLECGCAAGEDGRRCFDERCINWVTKIECTNCKKRCLNQRIRRGQSAPIEVFEVSVASYRPCRAAPRGS